jgi:hypothetical protein
MAHAASASQFPASVIGGERLVPRARMLQVAGFAFIAGGVALGWRGSDGFLLKAWLQAWIFGVSLCLGALFFTFIQHLVRAGWSVVVRRPAEAIAGNLQWLWLGFLPFVLLWWQGRRVRRITPVLPEPPGRRQGRLAERLDGPPARLLLLGDSSAAAARCAATAGGSARR